MKVGVALVDVLTAKDAVMGILAALRERETSGRGQRVEVNLLSSLLGSMANQASAFLATGHAPMDGQPTPIHRTVRDPALRRRAAGRVLRQRRPVPPPRRGARHADDERFRTNPARVAHRDELVAELERRLVLDTAGASATRLEAARVPAGRVGDISDGIALAHSLDLDLDLDLEPTVPVGDGFPHQIRHPITSGWMSRR